MTRVLAVGGSISILMTVLAACERRPASYGGHTPDDGAGTEGWLDRLPPPHYENDASFMDANLDGLVCRPAEDDGEESHVLPCERLSSPPPRSRQRHRPITAAEIPTLERMIEELPKTSSEYAAVLRRLTSDYLELACTALRECVRDSLSPPKRDPQSARRAAEIERTSEIKFHARCAELRARNDAVTARELCTKRN